ncbi:lipoprotein [Spiroplasma endosymbiont of Crioceris asparagi]|uniref:lipoprotein n=1 Tax=Spiroplasma endosymbiont of Crioceris asparagi TaxID=3066286 RepID=UPI0030D0DB9C
MKKLIGVLGSFGFVATSVVTTVACGHKSENKTLKTDDIKNNADVKNIIGLENLVAVNNALADIAKKIEGVDTLVGKVDEKPTNVKVTITLKDGYKLTGDNFFVIEGAIKAKDVEVNIADIKKEANKIQKQKDLPTVQAELNKIIASDVFKDKIQSLTGDAVNDQPTNVTVTVVLKKGFKLDTDNNTFVIEGAIKAKDVKVEIADIKKEANKIQKQKDLPTVQAELNKIVASDAFKDKIKSLTGDAVNDQPTNVTVTVVLKEGFKLDTDNNTFVIEGAIKAKDVEVNIADIKKEANKIQKQKDLPTVQAELNKIIASDVFKDKIQSLTGDAVNDQPTNVTVTVVLKKGFKLDNDNNTFVIEGAIESKVINIDAIKTKVNTAIAGKGLANLEEVQKKLKELNIPNVTFTVTLKDKSPKNVEVTVVPNKGFTLNSDTDSFVVENAINLINDISIIGGKMLFVSTFDGQKNPYTFEDAQTKAIESVIKCARDPHYKYKDQFQDLHENDLCAEKDTYVPDGPNIRGQICVITKEGSKYKGRLYLNVQGYTPPKQLN